MFPHHENEIAQSECCHGKPMAKYWMHNGLMQASSEVGKLGGRNTRPVEGDLAAQEVGKISKSKGSAPFRDMLKQFSGETIRFFVLSTQYRRPIDYSEDRLREVETGMDTFYRLFKRFERITGESFFTLAAPATRKEGDAGADVPSAAKPLLAAVAELRGRFLEAMDDDFNTGGGIGTLFDLVRAINKYADDEKLEEPAARTAERLDALRRGVTVLRELTATLGLFRKAPEEKAPGGDDLTGKLMKLLIELRAEARKKKDFATGDRIRNTLAEIGVALEDRPGGTEWSRK
jgi:cysteinyl-tRNA synthetase